MASKYKKSESPISVKKEKSVVSKTGKRIKVQGFIVKVLYPKNLADHYMGAFAIAKLHVTKVYQSDTYVTTGDTISIKGYMPRLEFTTSGIEDRSDQVFYIVSGEEVIDSVWGYQFEVDSMRMDCPMETPEEQRKFLSRVLTENQVNSLFAFTDNPIKLLEDGDIDSLIQIKGVSNKTAERLIEKYNSSIDAASAYVKLADYGLTNRAIKKLIHVYHSPDIAIARILENPYILIREVRGYGWKKADEIALRQGIARDSEMRVKAYTEFYLEEQCEANGHSWLDINVLLTAVQTECYPITDEKLVEYVRKMLSENVESHYFDTDIDTGEEEEDKGLRIITDYGPLLHFEPETNRVGLRRYYEIEESIANDLHRIQTSESTIHFDKDECARIIKKVEEEQGFEYTQEQRLAIWNILNNQVSILTGRAGCVDGETEFFSQNGWKKIKDFTWGDKVLQYNEDGSTEFVKPEFYHKEKNVVGMFELYEEGKYDITVTLNHTMIVFNTDLQGIQKIEARELITLGIPEKEKLYFITNDGWVNLKRLQHKSVISSDGYDYCFTVPSHMFVVKCNHFCDTQLVIGNCGKSYTVNAIVKIVQAYGKEPQMCALSGRASSKLGEITHVHGSTIHKLLAYDPFLGGFTYNSANRLPCDMVILDEASMVGGELFSKLLSAIPDGAKFLMVGDIAQLESIGMGNVLKDCMSSGVISSNILTKIHRQAQQSGIITESLRISQGDAAFGKDAIIDADYRGELKDLKFVTYSDYNLSLVKVLDEFKEMYYTRGIPAKDIQVIVPMRTRGNISCRVLNEEIQKIVNGGDTFNKTEVNYNDNGIKWTVTYKEGDRIVITKNDYQAVTTEGKTVAIFNGNMGYIKKIYEDHMIVDLTMQGEIKLYAKQYHDISLSYCLTCHKLQGSSAPYVIFAMDTSCFALYSRELCYTAITRARKFCSVVVQNSAFFSAIKISRIKLKQTWLKDKLQHLFLTSGDDCDIMEPEE